MNPHAALGRVDTNLPQHINQPRQRGEAQQINGSAQTTRSVGVFLEGFLYTLEAEGKSQDTMRSYAQAIRRYANTAKALGLPTDPCQITRDDIRTYLAQLRADGCVAVTCHDYLMALSLLFKWMVAEGLLERNPVEGIKAPRPDRKTKKGLTIDQVEDLLKIVRSQANDAKALRDQLMILMLADCGMRVSELCNLDLADVNTNLMEINIRQGKGRKQRRVAFGKRTRIAIWSYTKLIRGEQSGPLMQTLKGKRMQGTSIAHILHDLAQQTNWPDKACGPHKFRRTFAVESLRGGLDPFRVQLLLGHEKLDMTRLYAAELSLDDAIEAQRKVSITDRLK